jgi:hypothetical protein
MNLASAALQRGKASLNSSASANYPVDHGWRAQHDGAHFCDGRHGVSVVNRVAFFPSNGRTDNADPRSTFPPHSAPRPRGFFFARPIRYFDAPPYRGGHVACVPDQKLTRPRLMMRKRMVKLFVIAVVAVTLALVCVAIF